MTQVRPGHEQSDGPDTMVSAALTHPCNRKTCIMWLFRKERPALGGHPEQGGWRRIGPILACMAVA